jgi:ammonia channel protein AmtB
MAYYGINLSKGVLHIDDALDVHWVHGATGAVGVCVSKETYYSVKRDLLQHTALQAQ